MANPRLPERLTLEEAESVLLALQGAAAGQGDVTVDASAVRCFVSSAVAVLLELRRDLQREGRTLHVAEWPERLRDLVKVYGVEDLLSA